MTLDLAACHAKNTTARDRGNAAAIDNLLCYLSLCERTAPDQPSAARFSGAYLYGQDGNLSWDGDQKDLARIARGLTRWTGKLVNPVDDALRRESGDDRDILYDLSWARHMDAQTTRLMAMREPEPWMLHDAEGIAVTMWGILADGRMVDDGGSYAFRKGGRIVIPRSHPASMDEYLATYWANVVLHLWAVQTRWSVLVRLAPQTPAIGFFTDPTGIKELMKFRDLPEGKNRRDPVVHWVSQHWRQDRRDPEVETYVREHLRGSRHLHWHGMSASVVIPDADVAREESAREGRKRMTKDQLARRISAARRAGR